jgi:hypothetical protein
MEQVVVVLLIALFVVLGTMFLLFLRRASRLVATTRDVERFRRQAGDLTSRVETSLGQICEAIDSVRRGQLSAGAVGDDLTAAQGVLGRFADEARALRPPHGGERIRDDIVAELERAKRALEMVEHGASIQASARAGGREIEAQTAIKRGYLNVLHAREAIARHAVEAGAVNTTDPAGRGSFRRTS